MNPFVSICCLAYNHESFIRQCLDGFLKQKTDFEFEVLIHDDASTDNTANIIKEYEQKYPDIIRPIYQTENKYQKGEPVTRKYQFPRARGKYIAMCEGDDYWTDEYKLQKQINFLEENPEYTLCSHRYSIYDVEDKKWEPELFFYQELFKDNPSGVSFDFNMILDYWLTKLLTVVFIRDAMSSLDSFHYTYFRDVHLFYHILSKGKGYCMNFYGGVYNKHQGGVFGKAANKADIHYNVFRELFLNHKNDEQLKRVYQISLLSKINRDILNPKIGFCYSMKVALEPLWYAGDFTTSYYAICRIIRDRIWRVKNFLMKL